MESILSNWHAWMWSACTLATALVIAPLIHMVLFFVLKRLAGRKGDVFVSSLVRHSQGPMRWILPLLMPAGCYSRGAASGGRADGPRARRRPGIDRRHGLAGDPDYPDRYRPGFRAIPHEPGRQSGRSPRTDADRSAAPDRDGDRGGRHALHHVDDFPAIKHIGMSMVASAGLARMVV